MIVLSGEGTDTQREDKVKIWGEGGPIQAKERGFRSNQQPGDNGTHL